MIHVIPFHLAVNFITPPSQCSITPLPLKQLSHVLEKDLKLSLSLSVLETGVTFISGMHLPKSIAGNQTWKSESGENLKMSWQPSRLTRGTGGCRWRSFFSVINVTRLFLRVIDCRCFARPSDLETNYIKCMLTSEKPIEWDITRKLEITW